MPFPFRFYGFRPVDWKGAWEFDLQFARVPKEAVKKAIAESFVSTCSRTVVDVVGTSWQWSGEHARVRLSQRWNSDLGALKAFTAALMAAHRSAPLAQVVNLVAVESDSRWDLWSSQQQSPDPSPPAQSFSADQGFDLAVSRAIAAREAARIEYCLSEQAEGTINLVRSELSASDVNWELQWPAHVLEAFQTPEPPTERVSNRQRKGEFRREGYHPVRHGTELEKPVAVYIDDKASPAHFATLSPQGHTVERLGWPSSHEHNKLLEIPAYCGKDLFAATNSQVFRSSGGGEDFEAVWTPNHTHGDVLYICTVGSAQLLVVTEKTLVVLDTGGPLPALVCQRPNSGARGFAVASSTMAQDATLIVTAGWRMPPIVSLVVGDRFKKVGELPTGLSPSYGPGHQVVFRGPSGFYELTNVAELATSLRSSKPAPPKKARSKEKSCPVPILEPIPIDEVPSLEAFQPSGPVRAAFGDGVRLYPAAHSKCVVGLNNRANLPFKNFYTRLFVSLEGETAVERTDWMGSDWSTWGASISTDGRWLDVNGTNDVDRLNIESGVLERVWHYVAGDLGAAVGVACVDADTSVVLCEKGLLLRHRKDGEWSEAHRVKISKSAQLEYLPDDRVLLVRSKGKKRLLAYVVLPTKLKKILEDSTHDVGEIRVGEGMVFGLSASEAWMLTGLEDAARHHLERVR